MNCETHQIVHSDDEISAGEYCLRIAWIGTRLILVYCLMDEFQPFFYQAF